MMRRLVLPVAMVLLAAGCGCAAPSPIPPAYTEGRAFPSCTVPIWVSPSVQDRPRVKAAFAAVGRLSGYRFADSSYSDASAHGVVVLWGGIPSGYGGAATPTIRNGGDRSWSSWVIRLNNPQTARHEIGHTMGLAHVRLPGNVMNTPAGTSWPMVEPAAVKAWSPTVTGATRFVLQPMKA